MEHAERPLYSSGLNRYALGPDVLSPGRGRVYSALPLSTSLPSMVFLCIIVDYNEDMEKRFNSQILKHQPELSLHTASLCFPIWM